MSVFMNMLMLICASLAALAFGVLSAQALCRAAFAALGTHARSVASQRAAAKAPAASPSTLDAETATA